MTVRAGLHPKENTEFHSMTDTTQTHVLPYDLIFHPITKRVIAYTKTIPSRVMTYERGWVEIELMREDLDVHRRLLYEKIIETYKENS